MSFFDTHHFTPAPATIITPGPVGVESVVHVIGANGPTGPSAPKFDNDSDDDLPLTVDQEQNLLMKMNQEQGKTIEELQTRIKALERELITKPVPPICYIKCSHCQEEDKVDKK